MGEIVGQGKWTNTTNHTEGQSSSKEGDVVLYGRTGRESSIYKLLQENQTISSNQYCSQLDQLKAGLDEKCLKSVNRKCIIFH